MRASLAGGSGGGVMSGEPQLPRFADRITVSHHSAVFKRCRSNPVLPTNWTASGKPSAESPIGNETVGRPRRLHGELKTGSPVVEGSGAAPTAAGVTRASTDLSISSTARLYPFR